VSAYPANPEDMNLSTICDIKERFNVVPGLSDHSLGISASITAVALGACIIEKHFTMSRTDKGLDSSFSIEPEELKQLVKSVRETEKLIGKVQYGILSSEKGNIAGRRSLFAVEDIKAGQEFTIENTRCIRPGQGLQPKYLLEIIGKKAKKDIDRGTPLNWELIDKNN
jgi:N-acetylneuraminate synthase